MMKRSFAEAHAQRSLPTHRHTREAVARELGDIEDITCGRGDLTPTVEQYYTLVCLFFVKA